MAAAFYGSKYRRTNRLDLKPNTMEAGYLGNGINTWLPGSGSGGGGGGTGDVKMFGAVCGDPDGPVNGATSWSPPELLNASKVYLIFVNKNGEQSIGSADFTFTPGTGTIDRAPNIFVTGDTIIGWYKPSS